MNITLNQAKKKKNDEFYTLLEDIEEEMSYYDFTDKIIYCNCDDHRYSNFYHNVPEDTHLYRWVVNGTLLTVFY